MDVKWFPKSKMTVVTFYRVFWQILPCDCILLFQTLIGKIRQQGNRPAVYKKARVLCFADEINFSNFKFAQENAFEWRNIDNICLRSRNNVK